MGTLAPEKYTSPPTEGLGWVTRAGQNTVSRWRECPQDEGGPLTQDKQHFPSHGGVGVGTLAPEKYTSPPTEGLGWVTRAGQF